MTVSPMSNLDDNTFLTILDTITSQIPSSDTQTLDRPLTIIRAISQVSQRCRVILLSSPWIWGRAVDLDGTDLAGPRRIKWMDEVVRRAGSAPLWIYGNVAEKPVDSGLFNTQSYFIHLLKRWERIEKLSIILFGRQIPDDIQRRFLSPAPILRVFHVHLHQIQEPLFLNTLQPGSSQSLFGDHAPLLWAINADKVAFKSDSPWLPNIREISPIPRRLTLQETFSLLQHTPLLERLVITPKHRTYDGTPSSLSPKPNLPHLSSITMHTTLAIAARILDYISPTNLSWLHISLQDSSSAPTDPYILSSLKRNLPFYISSYFTTSQRAPGPFVLFIANSELTFCRHAPQNTECEEEFAIALTTKFNDQKTSNDVLSCFLDTFTHSPVISRARSSLFKPITQLTLAFGFGSNQVPPTLFPNLYSLFAVVFQHVQVIETNERCFQTFWAIYTSSESRSTSTSSQNSSNIDHPPRILFPELHTIRLTSLAAEYTTVYLGLPLFLTQRKTTGLPVAELILPGPRGCEDLTALEAVSGLEVIWQELLELPVRSRSSSSSRYGFGGSESLHEISRYICGSGQPDRLKSSHS